MGRSGPTSGDVARLAQVSRQTVNRALGGYGYASEEAIERVMRAAKELGYRPNSAARALLTGRSHTIGIVVVDIENPFFAALVAAVCDVALMGGYETFIMSSEGSAEKEAAAVEALLSKGVDGIIMASTSVTDRRQVERVMSANVPLITIDRASAAAKCDSMSIDNVTAGYDATHMLLSSGRRRIAVLTYAQGEDEERWESWDLASEPIDLNPSALRLFGYLKAHRALDVPVDPSLVRLTLQQTREAAKAETAAALDAHPDAVFATDNVLSIGAFRTLKERSVRVPDDVWMVAFDDVEWTALTAPPLTVVAQPTRLMGRSAARRLLDRLAGKADEPPRQFRFSHALVERESTPRPH